MDSGALVEISKEAHKEIRKETCEKTLEENTEENPKKTPEWFQDKFGRIRFRSALFALRESLLGVPVPGPLSALPTCFLHVDASSKRSMARRVVSGVHGVFGVLGVFV